MARRYPILICCVQFDQALKAGTMALTAVAEQAAALGAAGVEYREVYWREKASELPAVRQTAERLGLQLTYATFTPLFSAEAALRQQLLGDIDDAAALGSPLLRVFRGAMPAQPTDNPAAWAGAEAALAHAQACGLRLALENHINVLGSRLADLLSVLAAFDGPGLGVNIDTANYVQNDEPLLPAIERLRPRIIYSHLKDVRTVDGQRQVVAIGRGQLDFGAILAAYERVPQPFPLCFEFGGGDDPAGAIRDSLAELSRLGVA
jgi:sugar phosphate isomerase/epimerase